MTVPHIVDDDIIVKVIEKPGHDPVNHPSHYIQGGIETIDVIEAWELDYLLGNCVKYISRNGKKPGQDALTDLKKARWYLDRYISKLEKERSEHEKN